MTLGGGERDPVLVGPYRLVSRVGEGGMGVVHLALDPDGKAVAVKVLRAHAALDPGARQRLRREVDTLRRVRHPRVAAVIDADVDGDLPYLVTQFVPGRSLERLVQEDGPLPIGDVVRLGRSLADALQAIHAAHVVHRDVKPPNVLLVDGEPVIIDFGIAHVAEDSRITMAGLVMGTPGYLSPEVCAGQAVAPSTDWWGWGATLAFAATGRNPFGTGPLEVVLDRVRRGEADLAGIPEPARTAVAAALIVDPRLRPPGSQLVAMLSARPASPRHEMRTIAHATSPSALTTPFSAAPPAARATSPVAPTTPVVAPVPTASAAPTAVVNTPSTTAYPHPVAYAGFHTSPQVSAAPAPVRGMAPFSPAQVTAQPPAPAAGGTYSPPPPQPPELRHPGAAADARAAAAPEPAAGASRTGVLLVVWLTLVALGAVVPMVAALLATSGIVAARTVDRTRVALWRRRTIAGGARRSDVPMTIAATPWRVLTSAMATIPALLMPVAAGIVTVFSVGVLTTGSGVALGPQHPVSLGAGMAAATLVAWWGFGGSSVRRGAHSMARAVTPGSWGPPIAAGVLVLLICACLVVASHGSVDWTPLSGPPGVSLGQ